MKSDPKSYLVVGSEYLADFSTLSEARMEAKNSVGESGDVYYILEAKLVVKPVTNPTIRFEPFIPKE